MDLLGKGNSLPPILNTLSYRELGELSTMLSDYQFLYQFYTSLEYEINKHYYVRYLSDNYQTNNGQDVRDWMHGVCIGNNTTSKISGKINSKRFDYVSGSY